MQYPSQKVEQRFFMVANVSGLISQSSQILNLIGFFPSIMLIRDQRTRKWKERSYDLRSSVFGMLICVHCLEHRLDGEHERSEGDASRNSKIVSLVESHRLARPTTVVAVNVKI